MPRLWWCVLPGLLLGCNLLHRSDVPPSDGAVEYVGRFDTRDPDAPRFAWPASELRLSFSGASLGVRLGDQPHEDSPRETDSLLVVLDGKRVRHLKLREGTHDYVLAQGLSAGVHHLRLIKRTEPNVGTVTLHGFDLAPSGKVVKPAAQRRRRVEVVGDSISAGYGAEARSASEPARADLEDATRTYAAVAARELDADLSVIAWSGRGVLRGYDGRPDWTLLPVLDLAVPTDPDSPKAGDQPPPDVIVVHQGTNDFLVGIPEEQAFKQAYRALLAPLRVRAPKAHLVLVVSPMITDEFPEAGARSVLARWLGELAREHDRPEAHAFVVTQTTLASEGFGSDKHPNLATHQRLGRELAQQLRLALGW